MSESDAEFLKKLLELFAVEAAEHLAAISSALLDLEKPLTTEQSALIVETVFREAHSMKGAARSVALADVESVCQAMESVFSALKQTGVQPARPLLDLLHRAVDLLGGLISPETGAAADRETIRQVTGELQAAAHATTGGAGNVVSPEAAPQAEAPAPPAGTSPPALSGDTVRVAKRKLDSLLLQGEAFLAVKQAAAQRSAEVRDLLTGVATLRKEWDKIVAELKATAGTAPLQFRHLLEPADAAIAALSTALATHGGALERDRRAVVLMVDNLLDDLKSVSMLPFNSLLDMMTKVVRDLARDQGKEAVLISRGAEIEIDRRILDEIREPLIHLLRNCVDHGVEEPGERAACGKNPAGSISIDITYRKGTSVDVAVADDGRGIDLVRVRNSAVRLGIISPDEADRIDEEGVLSLMFRSGVSTSPIITEISGRGLGLPIVRERVERMGGSIHCESEAGHGTSFFITLPLSLARFRGVLVRIDDHHFVIPASALHRTIRMAAREIRTIGNRETVMVDGLALPVIPLRFPLQLPPGPGGADVENRLVQAVVLGTGNERIALTVDEVLDEQEVIVKPLGPQLPRVRNVLAATVLGSGRVVPILNVADLMKTRPGAAPSALPAQEPHGVAKSILVVEDSITARTLLKNILATSGYVVRTAVDGVDALEALRAGEFDLVVSDVEMPRMNGLDLTAKIRADRRLAHLPVILVTALQSREDQERGIDVGANAYIVKSSFDQSNLLEVIRRLL